MSALDMKKRKMLLDDYRKGVSFIEATNHIEKLYGKKGYSSRTCQRWYKKFKDGDFDLSLKAIDESWCSRIRNKPKNSKSTPSPPKKADTPKIVEERSQTAQNISSVTKNAVLEKLIQKKSELTISKVIGGAVARNGSMQQSSITNRNTLPTYKLPYTDPAMFNRQTFKMANAPPSRFNVRLPPNIAKRLQPTKTSTERHTIGEAHMLSQKTGEPMKKPITIQFQNVSPDVAKNTVRKSIDKSSTSSGNVDANKRSAVPQSTSLSLPKGVIYLNPQEIFKQSFGFKNTRPKPAQANPFPKPVGMLAKEPIQITAAGSPQPSQSPLTVSDSGSDSDDEIVFPENVSLPAPRMKALADTFTTYWDMETDLPILLNPTEAETPRTPPIIEID